MLGLPLVLVSPAMELVAKLFRRRMLRGLGSAGHVQEDTGVVAGDQMVCYVWTQLEVPGAGAQLDLAASDVDGAIHMMVPAPATAM